MGDLVLRWVLSTEGLHKLSPMWEGPFRIARVSRPGAARLETQDRVPIQNAWNIQHLWSFYPSRKAPAYEARLRPVKVSASDTLT